MRTLEVLVEEPSAEAALDIILPKIIGDRAAYELHAFGGLAALKRHLPARLRAYRSRIRGGEDLKVVVLIDEDRDERGCAVRKRELEEMAIRAGLATKSQPRNDGTFHVVNRLAIEELEAWFFGDLNALREAFPDVSASIYKRRAYRDPDAIAGGTAESLHRVLRRAGYYPGIQFLPKLEVARKVSQHMEVGSNRSRSFQVFRQGVQVALVP